MDTLSESVETGFHISELHDGGEVEWNRYVDAHPLGTAAHRAEWRTLIFRVFKKKSHYLMAKRDNRLVGVLPLVHMHSLLFGNFMVSVPYLNYGGVLADDNKAEQALVDAAARIATQNGAQSIEFREQQERGGGMPCRLDKVAMLMPLPESEELLAKQLGSKLRSQIKRPQRENPEVEIGRENLLDNFYDVFARNMRDLGTPVYSKRLFSDVLTTFPDAYIVVIRLNDQPIAAAFLLGYRTLLEIPWASTIKEVNHLSMNMLLYWEVLRSAIARGYQQFDFGRSTVDAGTYRFKKQWGAQPKQLYWYYWLNEGQNLPGLTTSNAKFRQLIRIWQSLPLSITKFIGPNVVKHLP